MSSQLELEACTIFSLCRQHSDDMEHRDTKYWMGSTQTGSSNELGRGSC